jgi:hypothetical protein
MSCKPEKVGQLSRRINFSLPNILALTKHGGSNEFIAVLGSRQLCGALEDSSSINERRILPVLLRLEGGVNGGVHLLFAGEGVVCEDGGVFCGEDLILVGVYLLGDTVEDDFALDRELRSELL